MSNKKVFLGGTCNGSLWREELKPFLEINYFDPVVDDWNEEAYQQELHERATADFVLYVITPKMAGAYAIAEVVDDSNKQPEKTVYCYLMGDGGDVFTESQLKSLRNVGRMVEANGGKMFGNLADAVNYLNSFA
ncbi:MAG: hypothetical protein ISS57_06515 [Anaerolineales bacterium]|nr:hypothetical protein [Anaerolineales bacterium]